MAALPHPAVKSNPSSVELFRVIVPLQKEGIHTRWTPTVLFVVT